MQPAVVLAPILRLIAGWVPPSNRRPPSTTYEKGASMRDHVPDPTCATCSPASYLAERLDYWKTADAALKSADWAEDYEVDPQDVLMLAIFLSGDALP